MSDNRATILVVDDVPENIAVLSGLLSEQYRVKAAINGELALKIARESPKPDLILLDVMMPEIDGYEVCRQLKRSPETNKIPVIFITAKSEVANEELGFSLGAIDYITKPINPSLVSARVRTHLSLYDQSRHLEKLVQQRTQELNDTRLEIIYHLGRAAEYKDNETGTHVIRMSLYAKLLAEKTNSDKAWCELVYQAAPMHDIGKIGIPEAILQKPGKLDADEWRKMKQHTQYGAEILDKGVSPLMHLAREVALYHHERWDGEGYPKGLSGEAIPLAARIVAIADVFDALTNPRPYKAAWPIEQALDFLAQQSGKHFDPQLVPAFLECRSDIEAIHRQYRSE